MAGEGSAGHAPRLPQVAVLVTDVDELNAWRRKCIDGTHERLLVGAHDSIIGSEIRAWRGSAVKTVGDGVLATFDDLVDSIQAAIAIQQRWAAAVAKASAKGAPQWPAIRIGICLGPAIPASRLGRFPDIQGVAVLRAFRLAHMTEGTHIMVAGADVLSLRAVLPPSSRIGPIVLSEPRPVELDFGQPAPDLVLEVRYRDPTTDELIGPQSEMVKSGTIIYGRREALASVAGMVLPAKRRVVIALRTLPNLTGVVPGDEGDEQVCEAVRKIVERPSNLDLTVAISEEHTRRLVRQKCASQRRYTSTFRKNLAWIRRAVDHGKMRFVKVDSLPTPLVIADDKLAIVIPYQTLTGEERFPTARITNANAADRLAEQLREGASPAPLDALSYLPTIRQESEGAEVRRFLKEHDEVPLMKFLVGRLWPVYDPESREYMLRLRQQVILALNAKGRQVPPAGFMVWADSGSGKNQIFADLLIGERVPRASKRFVIKMGAFDDTKALKILEQLEAHRGPSYCMVDEIHAKRTTGQVLQKLSDVMDPRTFGEYPRVFVLLGSRGHDVDELADEVRRLDQGKDVVRRVETHLYSFPKWRLMDKVLVALSMASRWTKGSAEPSSSTCPVNSVEKQLLLQIALDRSLGDRAAVEKAVSDGAARLGPGEHVLRVAHVYPLGSDTLGKGRRIRGKKIPGEVWIGR